MQTSAPTPARPPVEQLPTLAPPAATPVLAGQVTSVAALQERVLAYAQELAGLRAQRTIIQRQISRSSDPAVRAALELRRVPLETQIAQTEMNLATARAELAARQGQTETQPPPVFPPGARRGFDPDLVLGLFFAFIFAVLMPMSIAMARRIWRSKPRDTVPRDDVILPRMDRLEQAVDAIAIEIERISEGQRFVTRVLAERPASPAQAPKEPAASEGKPFLALGAGPAEPIRAAERHAVRESITPH